MITISVCDDERGSLSYVTETLYKHFDSYHQDADIHSFDSGEELRQRILEEKYDDMYFLDIDMPGMNGLLLAHLIRERCPGSVILFVSAREEYVFDTFQVGAFRFIRKSNFEEDVKEAVHSYLKGRDLLTPERKLTIHAQGQIYKIDLNKTLYIEAKDKYIDVVTEKETLVIRYRISELEKMLQSMQFLRIHKSFLVNSRYIYQIQNRQVLLDNGTALPISRYRVEEIQQQYMEYINT